MTSPRHGAPAMDRRTSASPIVTSKPEPWATPLAFSMRPVDVDPPATTPAVTADDRHAWIRAVGASLLPCHGCRSGPGSDRASTDARTSSRLSHKPVRKPVRQSVAGQQWSDRTQAAWLLGRRQRDGRNQPSSPHRCPCNLISPICATASVRSGRELGANEDARSPKRSSRASVRVAFRTLLGFVHTDSEAAVGQRRGERWFRRTQQRTSSRVSRRATAPRPGCSIAGRLR